LKIRTRGIYPRHAYKAKALTAQQLRIKAQPH